MKGKINRKKERNKNGYKEIMIEEKHERKKKGDQGTGKNIKVRMKERWK